MQHQINKTVSNDSSIIVNTDEHFLPNTAVLVVWYLFSCFWNRYFQWYQNQTEKLSTIFGTCLHSSSVFFIFLVPYRYLFFMFSVSVFSMIQEPNRKIQYGIWNMFSLVFGIFQFLGSYHYQPNIFHVFGISTTIGFDIFSGTSTQYVFRFIVSLIFIIGIFQ